MITPHCQASASICSTRVGDDVVKFDTSPAIADFVGLDVATLSAGMLDWELRSSPSPTVPLGLKEVLSALPGSRRCGRLA